jgi:hypothetical protein
MREYPTFNLPDLGDIDLKLTWYLPYAELQLEPRRCSCGGDACRERSRAPALTAYLNRSEVLALRNALDRVLDSERLCDD